MAAPLLEVVGVGRSTNGGSPSRVWTSTDTVLEPVGWRTSRAAFTPATAPAGEEAQHRQAHSGLEAQHRQPTSVVIIVVVVTLLPNMQVKVKLDIVAFFSRLRRLPSRVLCRLGARTAGWASGNSSLHSSKVGAAAGWMTAASAGCCKLPGLVSPRFLETLALLAPQQRR